MSTESIIVVGINDHLAFLEGWHDRTQDARCGIVYRPTTREAAFHLFLPGGDVEIVALVSSSVTLSRSPIKGDLFYNAKSLGQIRLDTENWVLRRFSFPQAPPGWCRMIWKIHNPFIPNNLLHNGDFREMGLYVASLLARNATLGPPQEDLGITR